MSSGSTSNEKATNDKHEDDVHVEQWRSPHCDFLNSLKQNCQRMAIDGHHEFIGLADVIALRISMVVTGQIVETTKLGEVILRFALQLVESHTELVESHTAPAKNRVGVPLNPLFNFVAAQGSISGQRLEMDGDIVQRIYDKKSSISNDCCWIDASSLALYVHSLIFKIAN